MAVRLHILGLPHTLTISEYSHCAFTGKLLRFSPMMRSVGYEVIHYGNGDINPGANKHEMILSRDEFEAYRLEMLGTERYSDKKVQYSELLKEDSALFAEFNRRLKIKLLENVSEDDIICCPLSHVHEPAIAHFPNSKVEVGIGYNHSFYNYRVFESVAWYQFTAGKQGAEGNNYWFVAPYSFDVSEWTLNETPKPKEVVFLGRLNVDKGLPIIYEIAKARPDLTITLCGQGDPTPYLGLPNIKYKEPISGAERSEYFGSAVCALVPTTYNEPFGAVVVEAHLCGTPVLTTSYGAFTETIESGFNGYRCHTLGDFLAGIRHAEEGYFDRAAIRQNAVAKYDMYEVAKKYDEIFQRVAEMRGQGWYSHKSYF